MTAAAGPGSPEPGTFTIDSSSAQIHLARALDFETVETYTLIVTAKDKGGLEVGVAFMGTLRMNKKPVEYLYTSYAFLDNY